MNSLHMPKNQDQKLPPNSKEWEFGLTRCSPGESNSNVEGLGLDIKKG